MAIRKADDRRIAQAAQLAARCGSTMLRNGSRGVMLETAHLTELCGMAADQLALAHKTLFDESGDADRALAHLDAALACLKQLAAESEYTMRAPAVRRRAC